MRKEILAVLALMGSVICYAQKPQKLSSPDGSLEVEVKIGQSVTWSAVSEGTTVLSDCVLSMDLGGRVLGTAPLVYKATRTSVDEMIHPLLAMKTSNVRNHYNQLTLKFNGGYSVEFRAYDDGVAYRFVSSLKGDVEVADERIDINLPASGNIFHVQECDGFETAYEEPYSHIGLDKWKEDGKMAHLPILIDADGGHRILVSESALTDYPGAFFNPSEKGMTAVFPKAPLEFELDGDRSVVITKEADYIAKTSGSRGFPWRYFIITKTDGDLIESTMPCRLAEPCRIEDTSWIKPGQASWEWWNGATPYGPDVNFKAGCTLETYKYFIDFASHYGIKYIVMDEGWANDTYDPFVPNPDVDLHELLRYGREKNVGIILWLTWNCVDSHPDVFETFEKWGVAGMKIDFMDRSDQWIVNFYERTVAEAAKHHLFIDFHGAYKPSGLEYKYPNLLSYEGVLGMEQMGKCTPANSLWHPFMRNVTGAMEYTPGAMLSMQPERYVSRRPNSASIGTRAYQLALFVVFESGIQMLADNPTLYYKNDECTRFIASVPVLWDETKALEAKAGEYAVVAKRSGSKWFVGGITAETEEGRHFEISLDFLEPGRTYTVTEFVDGINADRQAMDYRKVVRTVRKDDTLKIDMVRNGGYAAVIE